MTKSRRLLGFLLLLALLAPLGVDRGSIVDAAEPPVQRAPEVRPAVQHDTSPPLRDMPSLPPAPDSSPASPLLPLPLPPNGGTTRTPDAAAQSAPSGPNTATLLQSFDGLSAGAAGTGLKAPPDTNGAAGATQYVQMTNVAFSVFDKTTGLQPPGFPKANNTLWTGFGGGCETYNNGDPIVQYDKLAQRWVLTQFSVSSTPYLECVAVSTTSDATGAYNRYAFSYGSVEFPDYPKVGVWPDGYYVSYNIFNNGSTFAGPKVCALDRASMLTGAPATQQCFQLGTSYGGLLPSDLDGAQLPPSGAPNTFLNFGTNSLNAWQFHVDWSTPANTTLTGPTNVPVAAFTPAMCPDTVTCIPQPDPAQLLDSLGDRLMYRLAYRQFADHGALVVNHSVHVGGSGSTYQTGIRWYELRVPTGGALSLFQQGTYAPADGIARWMGSIAMDHAGNIMVGYSASSSAVDPGIRYTGRAPADPAGTMQDEATLVAGGGSQAWPIKRWGDYSSMSIDPVDDCTFWYTTEYLPTSGTFNWKTRIASFQMPACTRIATLSASSLTFASQQVGGASAGQSFTLTNNGQGPMAIGGISTSGDFAQTNNCPASVASGGNCTITITFAPTAAGARAGTLTIADDAPGTPHTVSLSGTGTQPAVTLSAASLAFGEQQVGTTSAAQSIVLTNTGTAPLTISGINGGSDFPFTTCPGTLAIGASCNISVTFSPAAAGVRAGSLSIFTNAPGSPHVVTLAGTGTSPVPVPAAWSDWNSQGGVLTDAPAATGFNGRVYVFAKGADNALYAKSSADGVTWTEWQNLGGVLTAAPAAASSNGQLYVFAKGADNGLYVQSSADGSSWSGWSSLGGVLSAPPAATGVGTTLYVLAKGADNALYLKRSTDGVNWSEWQNLGGVLSAAPAAAGFQGQLYVFAKGSDNALYEKHSADGVTFTDWANYGGVLTAAPAAASYTQVGGAELLYTFAKGSDNALYERHTSDGAAWTEWQSLGGQLVGPAAAAGIGGQLYTFVWWADNALYERHTLP